MSCEHTRPPASCQGCQAEVVSTRGDAELWEDWCAVTGHNVSIVDDQTIHRFASQTHPSARALRRLSQRSCSSPTARDDRAPAWPHTLRAQETSLHELLSRGDALIQQPEGSWVTRLQLRRAMFIAVMVAPRSLGGLGLDRNKTRELNGETMRELRGRIGSHSGLLSDPEKTPTRPESCPHCAVWSWLQVIGTAYAWQAGAVRALGHRRDVDASGVHPGHRCLTPDPEPMWALALSMTPGIDRWGWINQHQALHRSSLSTITHRLARLSPPVKQLPRAPDAGRSPQGQPQPTMTLLEQEEVLRRADELNRRALELISELAG